jgi:hypothetical protein
MVQETNIDRVQLGQLITAAVSFKIRSTNHRGESKRGKLYAQLHTVVIEGREACRVSQNPSVIRDICSINYGNRTRRAQNGSKAAGKERALNKEFLFDDECSVADETSNITKK